jgi:hypothetical protein
MANDNNSGIFSSAEGYAGYFGPPSKGGSTIITIARGGVNNDITASVNSGFLADSYQCNWGRSVTIKRVFNNAKPIAIVGFGQGTITLRGLIGTTEGFKALVGADGNDVCSPLTITLKAACSFTECADNGGVSAKHDMNSEFQLTGCVLSSVGITGQIESQSGTMLQQADVTFNIGGFKLA